MLEGLKEKATQPIGPLPAFAWVIVVVGGYVGYKVLKGRSSGGDTSTTATTVGATEGTVSASSTDINALTSQIATLGNQINTLTGTKAGGSTDTGGTTDSGNMVQNTYTVKAGDTLASVAKKFGIDARTLLRYNITNPYGLSDAAGSSLKQTIKAGWVLKIPGMHAATTTAANTAAAAVTTAKTVTSTAVADAGIPAPAPTYSSNTAVTSSVSNAINVTQSLVKKAEPTSGMQMGIPTMSANPIKSAAIQIPTVTTAKKIVPKTVVPKMASPVQPPKIPSKNTLRTAV